MVEKNRVGENRQAAGEGWHRRRANRGQRGQLARRRTRTTCVIALVAVLAGATGALADDPGWPREIITPGAAIVIYQPQVETFSENDLTSRAAVSVKATDKEEPVFGAVWFEARINTDRDTRTVTLLDTKVSRVRFPNVTPDQEKQFAALVESEIPKWDLLLSLDRLLTGLELAEKERLAAENLKMEPPKIIFATHAAVLVPLDGQPELRPIENMTLMRVVNTPYLMVFEPAGKSYYLNAGEIWYKAAEVTGPWQREASPPAEVTSLVTPEALEAAGVEAARSDQQMPRIIVATEPAELIVTEGEPSYTPFPDNELLYVSNTESDVLMEIATQQYYVLLSGRWYRSESLQGSWAYVPASQLPASFAEIPEGSEKGHLRVHVAGTEEANEAVMDAQIPQTAAIQRGQSEVDLQYDGEPRFQDVEDTSMQYATNTNSAVLKVGDVYYLCEQGVWFKSRDPNGPWEVADSVPDQIQNIPPSNPHYNVKYVYVYSSTPQVVYVGYTPAYVGCYPYHGTVVYGTGFHYQPWIGPSHYYPRSWTFGFSVRYNPWTGGWGFGFSAGSGGFNFSFGWGSGWYGGPWWGPRPGWWGAAGYRAGYRHGYRAGYWRGRASSRPRPVPYGRARNRNIHVGDNNINIGDRNRNLDRDNLYRRADNRARVADSDRLQNRGRAQVAQRRENVQNNVFADRYGNVFRRAENGWERRDRYGWKRS